MSLEKLGFSDFNILILPFNPLEFLNKSAKLYQTLESLHDKCSIVFGNDEPFYIPFVKEYIHWCPP
jgi:hypothetical protein